MSNNIVEFYNEKYIEEDRLSDNCDNRHLVEKVIKQRIYKSLMWGTRSILEVGAGTGVHSLYLAKEGHKVTACDLVPEHVKLINEKAKECGLDISTSVENALSLSYADESFDVVLLAGPIYHLKSRDDKIKAIKEARRVCDKGGMVVIDFLPKVHGEIQHFLERCKGVELDKWDSEDAIFSYNSELEMLELLEECHLMRGRSYGVDGITRFTKEDVNEMTDSQLDDWIAMTSRISNESNLIDLSEHAIIVGYLGYVDGECREGIKV